MPVEPSLHALAKDLVEEEPPDRPTIGAALACATPGSVTAARRGRERVALVVLQNGRAFAVPDQCPHDGGLLSDGYLDGDQLVCARHGWEFDVCTGRCPLEPRFRLRVRELRDRR